MDFFLVKKVTSQFLHLIPGCLFLILLAMLFSRTKFCRRFAVATGYVAALVLLFGSNPTVSNAIVDSLESRFEVMHKPPPDTTLFLTLGNYAHSNEGHPSNLRLNAVSLARITETMRLWKQQPNAKLLVGSSARFAMRDFAVENGMASKDIYIDDNLRDTIDEISAALKLQNSLPDQGRLVVVSSAIHLPRANLIAANARSLQITASPIGEVSFAPAEFIQAPSTRILHASSHYLLKTDRALHEYIGILWVRIKSALQNY